MDTAAKRCGFEKFGMNEYDMILNPIEKDEDRFEAFSEIK